MPPKRSALGDADSNAQPPRKRNSTGSEKANGRQNKQDDEPKSQSPDLPEDSIGKRKPNEYICMSQPYHVGNFKLDKKWSQKGKSADREDLWNKPAAEHPDWPYKIMAETWRKLCDHCRLSSYTDPDLFDMHIFTDFHAYGCLELVENLLIDFHKAHKARDLEQMWIIIALMAHWLNHDSGDPWMLIDDGERSDATGGLIGSAVLATLEEIDRAGELKPDSKFQDLGLVMALHLKFTVPLVEVPMEEVQDWQPHLIAYAKKAGIDLVKQGCADLAKTVKQHKDVPAVESKKTGDRWDFGKKFKALSPKGGDRHNIIKMSRAERRKYNFDGKDPLRDFSDAEIKEGLKDGSFVIESM